MNQEKIELIEQSIKSIVDYPKPGIIFRDVTSLIENVEAYQACVTLLAEKYQNAGFTKIIGAEARGFLFGAPLALALGLPFIPVRKPGKLPREVISETYSLEYGEDQLEIHVDAIVPGDKVLLIDDLLATGGTIGAAANLVTRLGGEAKHAAFIVNLPEIGGEQRLIDKGIEVYSICGFEGH